MKTIKTTNLDRKIIKGKWNRKKNTLTSEINGRERKGKWMETRRGNRKWTHSPVNNFPPRDIFPADTFLPRQIFPLRRILLLTFSLTDITAAHSLRRLS